MEHYFEQFVISEDFKKTLDKQDKIDSQKQKNNNDKK